MTAVVAPWVAVVILGAWRWRPPPRRLVALVRHAATVAPDAPDTTPPAVLSGHAFTSLALHPGRATTPPPVHPERATTPPAVDAERATTPPALLTGNATPSTLAGSTAGRLAVIVALVALAVLLALVWPPLALAVPGGVMVRRRWSRTRAATRHRHVVQRGLPDVVDLLVVAIGAGLTPVQAVDRLATLAPPPFSAEFTAVGHRARRGQRFADALDVLPEHLGEPVGPVARTIAAAERYGTPLGPALDILAHEARRDRRRLAEEAARTVPVKLCFPLVGCTLPAFVLLTIAPLVAGALRSLRL